MLSFDKKEINHTFSVLYVEDQKDIQEEFVDILSLFVDNVILASNGQEGLEKYHEHLPDIIITDIQMPVMSGLDMIKEIRNKDMETPIILTTAFNENSYLLDAISLGVEHYLLKPIMLPRLQERLEIIKKRLLQQRELEIYHIYLEDKVEEEISLREDNEALLIQQNKAAEVGQMVSVIAHQWKQPLHYLLLLIEDMQMEYDYQPLSKEYIKDFVKKGTDRIRFLSTTMDNFLHFYKSKTDAQHFAVSRVVEEIASFLSEPFKALGISLNIRVEKGFALYGIENEFQQVILNLINNAKEAFEGQKKEHAEIIVTISSRDTKGIVMIEDNAGGIPKKVIDNIFKLEYTTKKTGNGIGLYLVEKIITQRFKGLISVCNSENGAAFTLEFITEEEMSNE